MLSLRTVLLFLVVLTLGSWLAKPAEAGPLCAAGHCVARAGAVAAHTAAGAARVVARAGKAAGRGVARVAGVQRRQHRRSLRGA